MSKADVLLIEDSNSDAFMFQRALRRVKNECKVHVVRDGKEALDYLFSQGQYSHLNQHLPKVIFLDLKLPKINGLEVLEEIKNNPVTYNIPVVILSSSNEETDLRKAYELGVNSYLVKPFKMENYNALVSNITNYWLSMNITFHKSIAL